MVLPRVFLNMSVLESDTPDNNGAGLSLKNYWFIANRYRSLQRSAALDAIAADDLAYEARFLERNAERAAIRAAAGRLAAEICAAGRATAAEAQV